MSDIETLTIVFVVLFSILHFSTIYYLCKKPDISKKKSANLQIIRNDIDYLKKTNSWNSSHCQVLDKITNELKTLKTQVNKANSWNSSYSENSAKHTNELKVLKSEVEKFSGDLEILSSWRSSHSENSAKLTNEVKALKTQVENFCGDLRIANNWNSSHLEKSNKLTNEVKTLKAQVDKFSGDLRILRFRLESLHSESDSSLDIDSKKTLV